MYSWSCGGSLTCLIFHAEDLSGPAAGTPLQPATGGGPGLVSGSYGSANAQPNNGDSFLPLHLMQSKVGAVAPTVMLSISG